MFRGGPDCKVVIRIELTEEGISKHPTQKRKGHYEEFPDGTLPMEMICKNNLTANVVK